MEDIPLDIKQTRW